MKSQNRLTITLKKSFRNPNYKTPAYRQAGKCQMNVKVQNKNS